MGTQGTCPQLSTTAYTCRHSVTKCSLIKSVTFLAGHGEICPPHRWSTWRPADQPPTRRSTWTWCLKQKYKESMWIGVLWTGLRVAMRITPCGEQISPWPAGKVTGKRAPKRPQKCTIADHCAARHLCGSNKPPFGFSTHLWPHFSQRRGTRACKGILIKPVFAAKSSRFLRVQCLSP